MFIESWSDNVGQGVMRYSGYIVGYQVTVYLSNGYVDDGTSYGESYAVGCRWTIRIPSLGIDEEIEIDHTIVTCLGVPSISISNVTAFDTCVGTISLFNFNTAKVPFQDRGFPDTFADELGLSLPFPEGYTCDGCNEIPRYICVTKRHSVENKIRQWEVEWWNEFEWNSEFVPYHDEEDNEDVIGVWRHVPEDPTAYVKLLYLIQDHGLGGFNYVWSGQKSSCDRQRSEVKFCLDQIRVPNIDLVFNSS